jgi:cytoskeletal protein RodZ
MANTDKNMDQYFRERLSSHEVKPSKLAWERLESQLPQHQKKAAFPWMRVAAVGLILLGVGYIIMSLVKDTELENLDTTALVQEQIGPEINQESDESLESATESESPSTAPASKSADQGQAKLSTKTANKALENNNELLTEVTATHPEQITIAVPEIELPELKLDETVAESIPVVEAEEAPAYRVIIKSSGIKEEPQKQNLIAGIENKVEKIGGLISKVEQGFADLQDAKDNLFDINTVRKEKSPK